LWALFGREGYRDSREMDLESGKDWMIYECQKNYGWIMPLNYFQIGHKLDERLYRWGEPTKKYLWMILG
jgi:hypothetical protein